MKKNYIIPQICVVLLQHKSHLALSGGINGSLGDNDIDYGGVDLDGSIIPDVKIYRSIWDDEW